MIPKIENRELINFTSSKKEKTVLYRLYVAGKYNNFLPSTRASFCSDDVVVGDNFIILNTHKIEIDEMKLKTNV